LWRILAPLAVAGVQQNGGKSTFLAGVLKMDLQVKGGCIKTLPNELLFCSNYVYSGATSLKFSVQ